MKRTLCVSVCMYVCMYVYIYMYIALERPTVLLLEILHDPVHIMHYHNLKVSSI